MGNLRRIRKQMGAPHRPQPGPSGSGGPERIELDRAELEAILARAKTTPMSEEDYTKLHAVIETLIFLTQELEKKQVSVQRLKQLLFGATTESTRKVIEKILDEAGKPNPSGGDTAETKAPEVPPKAPGHGRNGAEDYEGAEVVHVVHPSLRGGDPCPGCQKGRVYETTEPGRLVRIRGQAPLGATVYELQKLRCNLCGEIFTAPAPPGVGPEKYDAESGAMIALLKYGSGMPFNRLERLEGSLGIPLPSATQWQIAQAMDRTIQPVGKALIRQAAQGRILHNDDTTMKILELARRRQESMDSEPDLPPDRKGVFTSGIVSVLENHRIALFFTGPRHAGENLAAVLKQRAADMDRPIQMCDALSRNIPESLQTILANCLAHGRRRFVEVARIFPRECVQVLEILKEVYANDAETKRQGLSPEQRLSFHQVHSGPRMAELKAWLTEQIEQHKVEPNSSLGEAMSYMLNHWEPLTLFLRQPGAPLDNNVCEAALKKAILNRKNAYFYKTENGAHVGDRFMSLIHTCELNQINPFEYLAALYKHADELSDHPDDWMPWNYRDTLEKQTALSPNG
jgi:transposase